MKRVVIIVILVSVFLMSVNVSGVEFFDDVYFKICADSGCDELRSVYGLNEYSNVYIKGFNTLGADVSFGLSKPDGSFEELVFSGDSLMVSITEMGVYEFKIEVSKDDYFPVTLDGEFEVFAETPKAVDLTNPVEQGICGDYEDVDIRGSNRKVLFGGLEGNRDEIREMMQGLSSSTKYFDFVDGAYPKKWLCPKKDAITGNDCVLGVNKKTILSYSLDEIEGVGCFGNIEGSVSTLGNMGILDLLKSREEKRKIIIGSSLNELSGELETFKENLQCDSGCEQRVWTGLKEINKESFLGFEIIYDYNVECYEPDLNGFWKANYLIEASKSCEEVVQ
tara:strand:- start:473 stop:1480 length:1008 start_codon:yes stop_codon:yes gene_type:complete